jgi:hypothetical protein
MPINLDEVGNGVERVTSTFESDGIPEVESTCPPDIVIFLLIFIFEVEDHVDTESKEHQTCGWFQQ